MGKAVLNLYHRLPIIVLVILVLVGIWGGFFGFAKDTYGQLKRPLAYDGDFLVGQLLAKNMTEGFASPLGVSQNPYLGYPASFHLYDYPINERLGLSIMWVFGKLTRNPFLAFNLTFFFSFILCALSFYWLCRKFRVLPALALLAALSYTFLAYHHLRFMHVFLANYSLVPVMIFFAYQTSRGLELGPYLRRQSLGFVGLHLLFSITNIYYCLFYCVLLVAGQLLSLKKVLLNPRRLIAPTLGIAMITIFVPLNFIENLSYRAKNGGNPEAVVRHPAEAEFYALKPTNILLPTSEHRLPWLAKVKASYQPMHRVEGYNESIGLFAVAGLFLSFFILVQKRAALLRRLSHFTVFLFAFGITGGLGALLTNFLVAEFRAYNRISIFIATLALLTFFLILNSWYKAQSAMTGRFALALLFGVFLLDSFPKSMRLGREGSNAFLEDQAFMDIVQARLPAESKILQLPHMDFPEVPPLNELQDYDHLKPYLAARKPIYFSYGAMKGRSEALLTKKISSEPLDLQLIGQYGFSGLLVDLNGYKASEQKSKIEELSKLLKLNPLQGGHGNRLVFFPLKEANEF